MSTSAPLSHLKVLDFTTLLPGPTATMMLADLGADIIRIESKKREDILKVQPPIQNGVSAGQAYLNRSKRSLSLDLKNEKSQEIINKLVQDYDIIIEQFRPGVMKRLGLDYESMKKLNPKIIYCSISGYGQTGPYKDRAGHDNNYLSIAGINGSGGSATQGPKPMGVQIADVAGGALHAVIGILAAIEQRNQTGLGDYIDISMTDCSFSMIGLSVANYLAGGEISKPESTILNGGEYYGYYPTSDGRYMSVGSIEPHFLSRLCETMGDKEKAHQALSNNENDRKAFKKWLEECFLQKPMSHWTEVFASIDACIEPVLTIDESCMHPHIKEREMLIKLKDSSDAEFIQVSCPIKFNNAAVTYGQPGCNTGEHSTEILHQLGYSELDINQLTKLGVLDD